VQEGGRQIATMAVCGELHAIGEACGQVFDELIGDSRIATADAPAGNQLGIGVDRGPGPDNARELRASCNSLLGDALLGIDERPDSISLQALAVEVAHRHVLIVGLGRADVFQTLRDGFDAHVHSPRNRA